MNINLEVRINQLENLEQYITSSRQKIQSILDSLKWNEDGVLKDNQFIRCSVEHSHRVPIKSVEQHVAKCALRKEGYDLNEQFLPDPLGGSSNSKSLIHIDDHKKIEILSTAHKTIPNFKSAWNGQDPDPKTSNRATCTFSSDERSVLHSYAIANTVGPPPPPEFTTIPTKRSGDEPLTYEEKLIQERDAKRRRLKYKSVHTNRKSYIEVMQEVIAGQMEQYVDWLDAQNCPNNNRNIKRRDSFEKLIETKSNDCIKVHEKDRKRVEEKERKSDNKREEKNGDHRYRVNESKKNSHNHSSETIRHRDNYSSKSSKSKETIKSEFKGDHRHRRDKDCDRKRSRSRTRERRRSKSRTRGKSPCEREKRMKRSDEDMQYSRSKRSRSRSSHRSKYKDK